MNKSSNLEIPLYREIEHTGDLGIELCASSRPELFRRAAVALAALLVEPSNVEGNEGRNIEITATDDMDLMHDLLTELLQIFAADGYIWRDAEVEERGQTLQVILQGEAFDPVRHLSKREIKAVTYHQLVIRNAGNKWCARIIFDV
jgi:SHS2 domain-containing protein